MFTQEWIRKFQQSPTPFYFCDIDLLRKTLSAAKKSADEHGYHIHYALKANFDDRLLSIIRTQGFGADCVSGNEVKKAIETGFPAANIFFAGVGKTDAEITIALERGIGCFNCESAEEIAVIDGLARKMDKFAPIALRLNPDIDAKTHRYITTGKEENKFGISISQLENVIGKVQRLSHIRLLGIHFHIGSQITDMSVFKQLCLRVNAIQQQLSEKNIRLKHINLGGGLGVNYENPDAQIIPDFQQYFSIVRQHLKPFPEQTIHFELGRALVGQSGSLISRVVFVKQGLTRKFVILDAGMTDLIRPSLYQASHKIENLSSNLPETTYDVVGPICESADTFAKKMLLPETRRGDLMAIRTAGAYARVMASHYNLRDIAPVMYSDEI